MGREAQAKCWWKGQAGEVKALLESTGIILRGDIRDKIARGSISGIIVDGDTLSLQSHGETLRLVLGYAEATKWAAALLKPLPTLAQKLGVDDARRAFVIGQVSDAVLAAALDDATTSDVRSAALLVAVIECEADLLAAYEIAKANPHSLIWYVHQKGKSAPVSDAAIRIFMRGNGYMDNKTSAVSEQLTATRYGARSLRE